MEIFAYFQFHSFIIFSWLQMSSKNEWEKRLACLYFQTMNLFGSCQATRFWKLGFLHFWWKKGLKSFKTWILPSNVHNTYVLYVLCTLWWKWNWTQIWFTESWAYMYYRACIEFSIYLHFEQNKVFFTLFNSNLHEFFCYIEMVAFFTLVGTVSPLLLCRPPTSLSNWIFFAIGRRLKRWNVVQKSGNCIKSFLYFLTKNEHS